MVHIWGSYGQEFSVSCFLTHGVVLTTAEMKTLLKTGSQKCHYHVSMVADKSHHDNTHTTILHSLLRLFQNKLLHISLPL